MMSSLLLTKLSRPYVPPQHVPRPHLIQRLNDGLAAGRRLTLVSAPAGFGKTICVSAWLDILDIPAVWLSLDPLDDEPERFFTYLVAALQHVDEHLGWELEGALSSGQIPPSDMICASLINDLLQIEPRLVLVLDDFQVIRERLILTVFETLVTTLPPTLHLVLITREDPSLPLARLRANNHLTEIRAADLRFTHAETVQFLKATMTLTLAEPDMAVLEEKTEGWVVGLQLAGLAMQQTSSPSRLIADLSGSHRHILSYLTEEVLNQQPPEMQHFLLQTAVLERLNGDLCDTVTGRTDSQVQLERLFNANLFLFPLDDERRWYRYHHLFADLLREILTARHRDEIPVLHQRASQWYAGAGLVSEALYHALAAEDREQTLALFETHAMDVLMQWRIKTVEEWLRLIPAEWLAHSLDATLTAAWMYLFRSDFGQATVLLNRAAALTADAASPLRARWLALQATLLNGQGRATESLPLAEAALALAPENDAYVHSLIYLAQAGAYQQLDDDDQVRAAYQNIIISGRAAGSLVSELLGLSGLALVAFNHGELHFAYETASQGEQRIEQAGVMPSISTSIYGELAEVYYKWHQLELAHYYFRRAIQVSALSGYSDAELYYAVIRSRLCQQENNLPAAAKVIQQAVDQMRTDAPAAVREYILAQQVRVDLASGRLVEAERVLRNAGLTFRGNSSVPDLAAVSTHRVQSSVLVNSALRLLLCQARTSGDLRQLLEGLEIADRLIHDTLQRRYLPLALETLLIRAEIHAGLGNTQASRNDYAQAVRLAEPEGFISLFVEEGQTARGALTALLQTNPPTADYLRRILAAFVTPPPEEHTTSLIEPLTEREREVLRWMAQGLKYQEIADLLVISLNTVRFYVKEIYSKLNVNNRTRALELARQQSLI